MRLLFYFLFFVFAFNSFSQDTIYLKSYSDSISVIKRDAAYFKVFTKQLASTKVDFFDINGTIISTENLSPSNFSIREGEYISYGNNGKVYMKGMFSNNKMDGKWITYNLNTGSVEKEENYENSIKEGATTFYLNSKPEKIYEYSNDKIVRKTCFDALGHKLDCDSLFLSTISTDTSGTIYDKAEIMPQFPGGSPELMKFLQHNIQYPDEARKKNLEGKVIVKVTIDEKGKLINPVVLKDGVGGGCAEEAIRVFNLMPKWTPGIQNHKFVKTYYVLPVTFKLQ